MSRPQRAPVNEYPAVICMLVKLHRGIEWDRVYHGSQRHMKRFDHSDLGILAQQTCSTLGEDQRPSCNRVAILDATEEGGTCCKHGASLLLPWEVVAIISFYFVYVYVQPKVMLMQQVRTMLGSEALSTRRTGPRQQYWRFMFDSARLATSSCL